MAKKRGPHPNEMLLPHKEIERRKQWCAQHPTQKSYERGVESVCPNQELALETGERDNLELPVSLSSEKKENPQREDDPNRHYPVPRRFHTHLPKTIFGQYRTAMRRIAEEKLLRDGAYITILKDADLSRVRRRGENKKNTLPPHLKNYHALAEAKYPHLHATLAALLYLKADNTIDNRVLTVHFGSSEHQIEQYYHIARLLNLLYQRQQQLNTSLPLLQHAKTNKT